jgi:hypothetical protein
MASSADVPVNFCSQIYKLFLYHKLGKYDQKLCMDIIFVILTQTEMLSACTDCLGLIDRLSHINTEPVIRSLHSVSLMYDEN